jgi:hypothetical protein
MAIALPLIVELFHGLDRAVQWLSGSSTAPDHQDPECTAHPEDGSGSGATHRGRLPQQDNWWLTHAGIQGLPHPSTRCLPHTAPAPAARQWRGPIGPLRLHPARRGWRSAAPAVR